MKKIVMLPILLGAAAAISFTGLLFSEMDPTIYDDLQDASTVSGGDDGANIQTFTYYDIEYVSAELKERGLHLSVPVPITDDTISQYCSYYDEDADRIKSVQYCTTSGITDTHGITVGNINLGGTVDGPIVALAVLDPVPPASSGRGHADVILEGVIESLVCDCWADKTPGGFQSVSAWMDAAESRLSVDSSPLKSTITGLAGVDIVLEASVTQRGYSWTLIILQ